MAKLYKPKGKQDWHAKIRRGSYDFKPVRLCTDKGAAEGWRVVLQAAVDRQIAGEPPDREALKKLPRRLLEALGLVSGLSAKRRATYAENVADYIEELTAAGRDAAYIRITKLYLTHVGDGCGWRRLTDIGRDAFVAYLHKRKADGTAPRTLNNITAHVKTFCAWAVRAQRLDENPIEHVGRVDETHDKRRKRRALMPDEVKRLLAVAGPRRVVYRVALATGLRRRELKRLQWRDVAIDETVRPCIELRAEATKSKRPDIIPLAPHLVALLRTARPDAYAGTDRVFKTVPDYTTWHADLRRAKIEPETDDGFALFHSLRMTFVSELERSGVSPRTIMQLARHTDYRLTGGTYTDVRVLDTFGAVGMLPDYADDRNAEANVALRTGTDDAPIRTDDVRHQIRDQKPAKTLRYSAQQCTADSAETRLAHEKTPPIDDVSTPRVGLEPTT